MGFLNNYRYRKEMEKDYKDTTAFLEQNGTRIKSFDEIVESGDLIAIVDNMGGFYAFVTNGYESVDRVRRDQSIDTSIDLYDQDLFDLDTSTEGNIESIHFNDSENIYTANVTPSNERSELCDLDDRAYFQKDGAPTRMSVGQGTLDRGIYRITNSELKARIDAVFFWSFRYGNK